MRAEAALFAEFETPEAIERAVETLHAQGYASMQAYTPHPMPELEDKLGLPRSWTPRVVLAGALAGAAVGFLIQYWLNGLDYPLNVGARPLLSAPAFIPITFETTVLAASLSAFATWLMVSRLPALNDAVFDVDGFTSVSIDRFWLAIATNDRAYDAEGTPELLRKAGALRVVQASERAA